MMDDDVSLFPLLQGLYKQKQGTAVQSICNDAYHRHESAIRIAKWAGQVWKRRRNRDGTSRLLARSKQITTVALQHQDQISSNGWQHWLIRSLCSDSKRVRQVSYAILLKCLSRVQLSRLLMDQVVVMSSWQMPPPQQQNDDCSVALVTVLTHVIMTNPKDMLLFCASGGLQWISRALWIGTQQLVPTIVPHLNHGSHYQTRDLRHASLVTIPTRMVLLVDLCYRLVLYASSSPNTSSSRKKKHSSTDHKLTPQKRKRSSHKERQDHKEDTEDNLALQQKRLLVLRRIHDVLWTSQVPAISLGDNNNMTTTTSLSPLACLICVKHVLSQNVVVVSSKKQQGIVGMDDDDDKCLTMLSRLVDPKTTVVMAKKKKQKKRIQNKKPRLRRRRRPASSSLLLFQSRDNHAQASSTLAAAEMARAVSDAMDLMDSNHNESSSSQEDNVIMQDADEDGNDEQQQLADGDEEGDMEVIHYAAEQDDDDDDDDDEEVDFDDDDEEEEEVFAPDQGEDDDEDDDEEDDDDDEDSHDGDEDEAEPKEQDDADNNAQQHDDEEEEEEEDLTQDLNETKRLDEAASAADQSEVAMEKEQQRKHAYVIACMQVLAAHYPHNPAAITSGTPVSSSSSSSSETATATANSSFSSSGSGGMKRLLGDPAEQSLLKSVCDVVKPPRKRLNFKIYMKRASTQEEFFRGSLSRNPMSLSSLAKARGGGAPAGGGGDGQEPTVRDLRQHIAHDLQMSDSAELLEILVANKILDLNLKLRVVHQVLWKNHLMEDPTSSFASSLLSGQSGHAFLTSGTSISMVLSATMGRSGGSRGSVTADTPASLLPPMVVTYRLAGVDGEATEDHVEEASLADPEAPSPSESPEAHEMKMEKEYGITRLLVQGRGIHVLLRSVESHVMDVLRRIRRDDVVSTRTPGGRNPSREEFLKSAPGAGLVLLSHCSKLALNRKKLLEARAPTLLLRLLLDVLSALEGPTRQPREDGGTSPSATRPHTVSNPTADVLKELIEMLASDISPSTLLSTSRTDAEEDLEMEEQDASTLPLLLSSLKTTFLSPPLRKVIGKLLPFLTYGQVSLSRDLAHHLAEQLTEQNLVEFQTDQFSISSQSSVMMDTFVQATIHLPPSDICNSLRTELLDCGFVERLSSFCVKGIPSQPPPWSPALWSKGQAKGLSKQQRKSLEDSWRAYFERTGLQTGYKMLTGLCSGHAATQSRISTVRVGSKIGKDENDNVVSLLAACHWIESTSDNSPAKVDMNGMGILAETLLDELKDGNKGVGEKVCNLRRTSRDRKKEIANERRSRALVSMNSFGATTTSPSEQKESDRASSGGGVMDVASSILAPVLGFFQTNDSHDAAASASDTAGSTRSGGPSRGEKKQPSSQKPAWLAEMEAMEDETGLTCAVCQEGRTLQPTELLGLYTFVKKVSPPIQSGGAFQIDGSMLLLALPAKLPPSLRGTHVDHEYFTPAKEVERSLRSSRYSSSSSGSQGKRPNHFITTVSAGNAIHCTCHAKARSADRSHPKAPKSEWEGAALRNSRVACNAIMPLVSSKSSKVHLAAVEVALTDYQTVISNLLGSRPKSMLWTILHDIRFLLLRMAYGEALNTDCGGGSLSSNARLLFHEMFMGDMFANDAEHDSPETAQHARFLSGGFIAAFEIMNADDFDKDGSSAASSLARNIADAAPMAALCCVLFNNDKDDDATVPGKERRWEMHKDKFLCGLICCAGRRHALGIDGSGCLTARGSRSVTRMRSSSFTDWDVMEGEEVPKESASSSSSSKRKPKSLLGKRGLPEIDDFAAALRPLVTFYAMIDQLSELFNFEMDDDAVEDGCTRLAATVEACQRSKSIHELLQKAKVTMDHERIIEELQKGIVSA